MAELLVLGLGNLLLTDDGLGPAAVRELERRFVAPAGVEILDGGTLGLSLLGELSEARAAILVDAVAADAPAGSFVRLDGDEVAPAAAARLSPHQVGVADLIGAAQLLGRQPPRMILLGLVPQSLELGVGCSPPVAANLEGLVTRVADECRALGHPLVARAEGSVP
jgi:hydrogenase maturation protease